MAKDKITRIEPRILKGTRDFLPKEKMKRDFVMNKIQACFERFGYDPIETPVIEYAETLLGKYGEEGSKLVYSFEDNGGRNIALRYDQTVPFARVVASNFQELPMPFKRYQISRVWRADKPAKGRYREFCQCDIDIIGTRSLVAEAEIACLVSDCIAGLGFKKYTIQFNSRRLINSVLSSLGFKVEDTAVVLRNLDKLEKVGEEIVRRELLKDFSQEQVDGLFKVISVSGSNREKVAALSQYDTSELEMFLNYCDAYGVDDSVLLFDLSLARGLDYYTGIIFEASIEGAGIGSVCGGGRYDDLCGLFTKQEISGVGVAFGFDRLVLAMDEAGLLDEVGLNSKVLVTQFSDEMVGDGLGLLREIQASGISAEFYFEAANLKKQMKYADKKDIPFVVIYGPDEKEKGVVTVKLMDKSIQKEVPLAQLCAYLNGFSS